jgi:hypothetical protein
MLENNEVKHLKIRKKYVKHSLYSANLYEENKQNMVTK